MMERREGWNGGMMELRIENGDWEIDNIPVFHYPTIPIPQSLNSKLQKESGKIKRSFYVRNLWILQSE